jgi:hypothetical protein
LGIVLRGLIAYIGYRVHFNAYPVKFCPGTQPFSELENDTLNQAELNEIKINENN